MTKKLRLTIDGRKYHAFLEENPLTQQLEGMCPFEMDIQKRGGHEYYASLPRKLSQKKCRIVSKTRKNQITYFDGWNALSFLYEDADISPYSVAYLGEFEEDVAAYLRGARQKIHIRCELDQESREERDG